MAKFSATRSFQKDHGEAFLSKLGRASLCRIDAANATFQSWRHLTSQRSMRKSGVSFCSTVWHRCRISWAWRCFWDALFEASYIPKESWTGRHLEAACWKTRFRSALFGFYIHKESWKGYTISKPHVEKHVFGVPFLRLGASPKKAEKGTPSWSHMLKDMFLGRPFWSLLHPQRKLKRAPHLEATCWKTCFLGALFEAWSIPKGSCKGTPSRSHMLKDMFLGRPFWSFLNSQRKLKRAPHLEATCWKTCFWGALFGVWSIPKESWKGHPILKPHVERHVFEGPFWGFLHPQRKKEEKGTPSGRYMLKDMFSGCPWGFLHPQRKRTRAPHLCEGIWRNTRLPKQQAFFLRYRERSEPKQARSVSGAFLNLRSKTAKEKVIYSYEIREITSQSCARLPGNFYTDPLLNYNGFFNLERDGIWMQRAP